MKTPGRILVILAVTAVVTAALYLLVSASNTGASAGFPERGERFQPGGALPNFEGARPDFEGGRERGEIGEGGFLGIIRSVLVIGVIVAIIIRPKSLKKRNRMTADKARSGDPA